jgi:hypothetical protein
MKFYKVVLAAAFVLAASPAFAGSVYIDQLGANMAQLTTDLSTSGLVFADEMASMKTTAASLASVNVPVGGLSLINQQGIGNLAEVQQDGFYNIGLIRQIGNGNIAGIYQTGSSHSAVVFQSGNGNTAIIRQR